MDGISNNNFLGYFLLNFFTAPALILYGYAFSFAFKKQETAQQALGEFINLTLALPWAILAFATSTKNVPLENALSLIPGFALYRGYSILEAAAVVGSPFSARDVFLWVTGAEEESGA